MTSAVSIRGSCAPEFARLGAEFERNFTHRGELGAALCLWHEGRKVVDLWGGLTAPEGDPWQEETLHLVFSCTKVASALCLHLLVEEGRIDPDAPLSAVWPELRAGQLGGTLRMLFDHSLGLPALRAPLPGDAMLRPDLMEERLAAEEPWWVPGTGQGYHALTFGFLAGGLVRRLTGESLGTFFARRIAKPLGIEFYIGLPEALEPRVAPIEAHRSRRDAPETAFLRAAKTPGSATHAFVFNSGDWAARGVNSREGHAAEIGAAGGISNARGLAGLFEALTEGGHRLGLSRDRIAAFSTATSACHCDQVLRVPARFGAGFMLGMDNRAPTRGGEGLIFGRSAFGHIGMGGSLGFSDPGAGLSFGYAMNRQGPGLFLNERGQALVDAAYLSLGYQNSAPGFWQR
ncbi:serine hydrolase domain-containing protein [Falsigemmobacter faecalis]|uniref:Class A beta-lactamase-related serine hydrolase n=1 Tax=Falsigemmobacter faecalis TaxID=2488730 RepID=A0A3P3DFV2_9RHOB|nr:serine hydrolase domain-containing protein [Falsigemmobacter faecalis]RRH72402.1 class A beta-lactamase-related serine hydrolase [Falsigemmobacter faecalis]